MRYSPSRWLSRPVSDSLKTPQVLVHEEKLQKNILDMSSFAQQHSLRLRPHFKTHKTAEILQLQLKHGACGVTVAKISEAEEIVTSHLFKDMHLSILIAYPIVSEVNFLRLLQLQQQADIILMVDHLEQAIALNLFAEIHQLTFSVMVKINTGLNRCGLEPKTELVLPFIRDLLKLNHLNFIGLMTHAGHAYGARTLQELQHIGKMEAEALLALQKNLSYSLQLANIDISVGSTPTVRISGSVSGVNEIRPGNYVFYDRTQVGLGVAAIEQCALRVVSRVVSHPAPNRWIIDAGSKTLTLDQGAHGQQGVSGFGYIVEHSDLTLTRLSEEHGVIEGKPDTHLHIGDLVEIIPNHACPVVNLADEIRVYSQEQKRLSTWNVQGRGKNN